MKVLKYKILKKWETFNNSDLKLKINTLYTKYELFYKQFKNGKYSRWVFLLLKSLLQFFILALIVITIVFLLIDALPGENGLLQGLDDAQRQAVIHEYGLSDPTLTRYGRYLANLFKGNFGISYTLYPFQNINSFIWERFGTSFVIGIISVALTLVIGIPLGIFIGKNPGKIADSSATLVIAVFTSIPSLVLGLIFLLVGRSLGMDYIYEARNLASWFLPTLSLSVVSSIVYVKFIRTELNEQLNSQHAKFVYLKGGSKNRFLWKHALKPALFPIATFFPIAVLGSFIGSIFIEQIFQIPGSGALFLNAIQSKDQNVILFMILMFSLLTIISFILRDVLYEIIDPRLRRK